MSNLIQSLFYASPYAELPPGVGTAGINLATDPKQSPTPSTVKNPVLVIRLRMANSDVVIGTSATSGAGTSVIFANFQPDFPLSATESYMLDIIWVPLGTPPANIDWTTAVTSAPITAATVSILSASYNNNIITAQVAYGPSGVGVGTQVDVWSLNDGIYVNVGSAQSQETIVSVPVNLSGYSPVLFLSAEAVIPASNIGGGGSFTAPFSQGPPTIISANTGIPQPVRAISAANYDGNSLNLSWSLQDIAGNVAPDSSIIQLFFNNKLVATFKGGPNSANISLDLQGQTGYSVQVSTVSNNLASAPVSSLLVTQAPIVSNVTANITAQTITATVTTAANTSAQAWLMEGAIVLAGPVVPNGNTVTFSYNAAGRVGLSVVASTTASTGVVTGPRSAPVILLATAVVLKNARIYTNPADATQWSIAMEWLPLPDQPQNILSYTAAITSNSTPITSINTTGTTALLTVAKSSIDSTKPQTLQLSATGVSGGTSPVQNTTAIFAPPLLTSLTTNASQIIATWNPPAVLPANSQPSYQVVVASGGVILFTSPATFATSASIPLVNLAIPVSGNVSVMINLQSGPVLLITDPNMNVASSGVPILRTPVVTAVTTDAITNLSTLHWNAVPAATGYIVSLSSGVPQTVSQTQLPLNVVQPVGAVLGFSVQATTNSNGISITGPATVQTWVPTQVGNIADVRFNGSTAAITWEPVPGALGYTVSIFDNSNPAKLVFTTTTTNTSINTPLTVNNALVYTVYLQPVTTAGTGLSQSLPLFSSGIFLSQQPASVTYPYLYSADALSSLGSGIALPTPRLITLLLPELGAAPGALGTDPINIGPFTIQPSGNSALPYQLTIAADNNVWGFTKNAIRLDLQSSYVAFLTMIEHPAIENPPPGITQYGINLVQAAIAAALPQTFAEQLYYNFGLSTSSGSGAGYVDLRPGMVLRVMASDYINITANGLPSYIKGYAGGSTLDIEISSYMGASSWLTGFDSFFNVLSAASVLSVDPPAISSANYVQAGIAAAADLYFPQFLQPFYRLFFPTSISIPWDNGTNTTNTNFAIAAAPDYRSLQTITNDPAKNATAYFRGRAIVEVMIRVIVNGNEKLVPIGTTLGNLLEQLGSRPVSTSAAFNQVKVLRSVAAALTSSGIQEIRLDYNGMQTYSYGTGLNTFSLPLLCGDQIFTNAHF